jgi:hypothetical protein
MLKLCRFVRRDPDDVFSSNRPDLVTDFVGQSQL